MFFELIRNRRSVRRYTTKPLEKEKIESLIEAGLRAPSSRGLNPWEFILIDKPDLLSRLAAAKHGADFLKDAPLGIVVCADPDRCDVWVEDCSIATTILWLAAEELGLGACWIQIRERKHTEQESAEDYVRRVLELPAHLKVEAIMAIGYPAEHHPPHNKESLLFKKIHYNGF